MRGKAPTRREGLAVPAAAARAAAPQEMALRKLGPTQGLRRGQALLVVGEPQWTARAIDRLVTAELRQHCRDVAVQVPPHPAGKWLARQLSAPPLPFDTALFKHLFERQAFASNAQCLSGHELSSLSLEEQRDYLEHEYPLFHLPRRLFDASLPSSLYLKINSMLLVRPTLLVVHHPPALQSKYLQALITGRRRENDLAVAVSIKADSTCPRRCVTACDWIAVVPYPGMDVPKLHVKLQLSRFGFRSRALLQECLSQLRPHEALVLEQDGRGQHHAYWMPLTPGARA